jgi:hypothetical protein
LTRWRWIVFRRRVDDSEERFGGVLEFVGQAGEGGEADAASLLAGADGQRDAEVCLAGPGRVVVALLMLWSFCRSGCG